MNVKEKLTLNVEQEMKEKARQLSDETRISISEIFELLIRGLTESEILKLYNKKRKEG
jgi:antitoxin component of RelBE/YafQ-DinJ toxin-antitoxin module